MDTEKQARGSMSILFLVVLIDMIGFTLVIPFLTIFIQDFDLGNGFTDIGTRDRWVGIVLAAYTFGQFLFTPILGTLSDRLGRRPGRRERGRQPGRRSVHPRPRRWPNQDAGAGLGLFVGRQFCQFRAGHRF